VETEFTLEPTPSREPAPTSGSAPVLAGPAADAPAPAPSPVPYRDRSTLLAIFGVFQIIFGLMAALMIPLIALSAFMSRLAPGSSMRPGQYVSASATYLFIAGALICLGIGSMRAKRWARSLTLVVSWYWLIVGVLITILLTAVLPVSMRAALQAQQNAAGASSSGVSTGVMAVILTIMIVFIAIILIAVPIAYVVVYTREDVAATCRYRDPAASWTDRAPLPVLGASVVFFLGSLYLLVTGVSTPVFPFFGRYLTGIVGSACFVVLAALDAYLAIALFRLKSVGWWIAILTVPLRVFSMALTYARADLMQAYSKMGMSDTQLQMMQSNPVLRGHVILWWSLLSMVILFGYLLWLKRYFKSKEVSSPAATLPAQAG